MTHIQEERCILNYFNINSWSNFKNIKFVLMILYTMSGKYASLNKLVKNADEV